MRAQSAIEFLTTYSFLFLIMAVAVSVILFLASAPAASIPSQCSGYAGLNCNFVQVYANQSASYTLVTLLLSNSQGVPVNVSGISATVRGATSTGTCTPSFMYPGQGTVCAASFPGALPPTYQVQGTYSVNAMFCNSGIANVSSGDCNYELVSYGGAFTTTPVISRLALFSVVASQSPSSSNIVPLAAISSFPVEPNNYTILQDGQWVTPIYSNTVTPSNGGLSYAYASNAQMLSNAYFGIKPQPYPASLSSLTTNGVACTGPPYNSVLSIASTTLYISSPRTLPANIEAGGAMALFYRYAQPGQSWVSALPSTAWKPGAVQTGTTYNFFLPLTNNGLYNVEVWWSDTCGSGGQVFQVNSIPN
jgi:hypothetical protein